MKTLNQMKEYDNINKVRAGIIKNRMMKCIFRVVQEDIVRQFKQRKRVL